MNESKKRHLRRTYLVDYGMQFGITLKLLSVMVGIAALYAAAIYIIPGGEALEELTAKETRELFFRANFIYWSLATGILVAVALLATHRIAGPGRVMERALDRMLVGDMTEPIRLRKGDHLQNVADRLADLQALLHEQYRERTQAYADLRACLDEGDAAGAREILDRLAPAPKTEQPVA